MTHATANKAVNRHAILSERISESHFRLLYSLSKTYRTETMPPPIAMPTGKAKSRTSMQPKTSCNTHAAAIYIISQNTVIVFTIKFDGKDTKNN